MSETDKIKLAYWTRYREVAEATPEFMKEFDASKASGIRLYKTGRPVRTQQDKWDDFIKEQLGWAIKMKNVIRELEL